GSAHLIYAYCEGQICASAELSITIVKTLTSLSISPNTINVTTSGTYELSGITATAHYSDSTAAAVTGGTWSKASGDGSVSGHIYTAPDTTGSAHLIYAYCEGQICASAELSITIVKTLTSLSISPNTINVTTGGTYELSGITATAHYSDSTAAAVTGGTWSKTSGDGSVSGHIYTAPDTTGSAHLIYAYCEGQICASAELSITTIVKTLSSLSLNPNTINVTTGGTYELSGITATAHYSDSTAVTVTGGTWSKTSGEGSVSGHIYTAPDTTETAYLRYIYCEGQTCASAELSITIDKPTITWQTDFDTAQQLSSSSGKKILIDFCASWCGWCAIMDQETYSNSSIIQLINDSFIPLRLDDSVPANSTYYTQYNITGLPACVILNSSDFSEVTRFVGYRDAATFSTELQGVNN
ncbi:MAG: DUF255 domain-containing protein, partial [Candidatus Wallbacteria bacterium]|nr:DUF255 domain-containing protein [Candidatus Wallbacteria bacterium]